MSNPKMTGDIPVERTDHSASLTGTSMVVFGGVGLVASVDHSPCTAFSRLYLRKRFMLNDVHVLDCGMLPCLVGPLVCSIVCSVVCVVYVWCGVVWCGVLCCVVCLQYCSV